ncbi:GcrA family cell cycle regulator [Methylocystis echinoides]|uniref:GcrA cell cycle regulator n=1 Tax=Methylocystis echinoides TaxID=29468 RepID=A0A9W6GR21_9HYPH|nr:GcrA family cell cycle regulator [Methylocystis echinoides]GLI91483.1 GcrA cell cycle regulator [Methylocystis echinoides]
MSWSEERVELLRKLWSDGLSASQVAAELGPGITRNAVIGKIHRLGLAERAKSAAGARPRPAKAPRPQQAASAAPAIAARNGGHGGHGPASHGPVVHGNVALAFAPQTMAVARVTPEEVVIPMSERVTLMELRESMCRWPMGDPTTPEFRFCGAHSPIGGGPYCAHHASVAYQPAQDRRRRDALRAPRYA